MRQPHSCASICRDDENSSGLSSAVVPEQSTSIPTEPPWLPQSTSSLTYPPLPTPQYTHTHSCPRHSGARSSVDVFLSNCATTTETTVVVVPRGQSALSLGWVTALKPRPSRRVRPSSLTKVERGRRFESVPAGSSSTRTPILVHGICGHAVDERAVSRRTQLSVGTAAPFAYARGDRSRSVLTVTKSRA